MAKYLIMLIKPSEDRDLPMALLYERINAPWSVAVVDLSLCLCFFCVRLALLSFFILFLWLKLIDAIRYEDIVP